MRKCDRCSQPMGAETICLMVERGKIEDYIIVHTACALDFQGAKRPLNNQTMNDIRKDYVIPTDIKKQFDLLFPQPEIIKPIEVKQIKPIEVKQIKPIEKKQRKPSKSKKPSKSRIGYVPVYSIVPADIHYQLAVIAQRKNMTMSHMLRSALETIIKRYKPKPKK